jgi:prolipoprotein diacylglyceryltransferase
MSIGKVSCMPVYVHIVRVFGKVSFASTSLRRLSVVAYTELAAAPRIVWVRHPSLIYETFWSHLFN